VRVLLVSKVRAGGHLYYVDATTGPGGRGTEPPGHWMGNATRRMDMGDVVGPGALEALMAGGDPRTGEPLGADRRQVSVAAFDLTFCAPKSVSLLHALGPDEVRRAVEEGHDRAVTAALSYVEGHALAVRRRVPGVPRVVPVAVDTFPAAGFVHRTSRALDPHLHCHVLVANVGVGPDGGASALDGRGVYAHQATAGALYHAQLRHELTTALGVAWEPLDRGHADVAGIGPEARREFSRRSAAVAVTLAEWGLPGGRDRPTRRAATMASLISRPAKDLAAGADELLAGWQARARAVGLGPGRLEAVLDRVPNRSRPHDDDSERALVVALADQRSLDSPFARRHMVRAWASSRQRGAPVADIEKRVDEFLGSGLSYAGDDERSRLEGPGVGERRRLLPERLLSDELAGHRRAREGERHRIEQQLRSRGRGVERPASERVVGVGRALDQGLEVRW
jgi:conjugative relaxase-like TrwC/TraI family protein